MEPYVKDALHEWKEEIENQKKEIDEEYKKVKLELQLYSFKYGITKQVIQSTINEEMINNIKTTYQKPFEEKYNRLKQQLKKLEDKRSVFNMFVEKIENASKDQTSEKA
jgi:N-acetyl-gamma-glutamylphosphate reductase